MQDSKAAAPLDGLAVVELGHSVAAPYAGQILADLGATVVKVENPDGGDDARQWGPPFWHGSSAVFQTLNRNKYSATFNIKDEKDRAALRELVRGADIVIQNMRPGLVEKYGLDAKELRKDNTRLIYCNLAAFGATGPLQHSTGYDPLIQAFSGIMSVTGEAGRGPVRVGPSIIDMGAGLWCVIGIMAALVRRQQTGQGVTVDTSLYETGLAWMNIPLANCISAGRDPGKSGSETPMLVPYRAFQASDRHIVIAAGNDNLFRKLAGLLGHPQWADDTRFKTNEQRVINRVALNELIGGFIAQRPSQYWMDQLNELGVPCAPVQSASEVIAHPQTHALGMLQPTPDDKMVLVGTPLSFDGVRPDIRHAAPELGADTQRAAKLLREGDAEKDSHPAQRRTKL
ncbi:MAG TPA: CoA transferase [Rhizomicrobium sp.]|nr:CoA transferase [Rhizomicrobium sp.]